MNRKKLLLSLLSSVIILACCILIPHLWSVPMNTEDEAFTAFTQELFQNHITSNTLTLHYTLADPDAYDIPNTPVTLGLYSSETEANSASTLENMKAALTRFSRENLSASNQLTFDILSYQIEQELNLTNYEFYQEIFSPTLGEQAQLPILLAEYAFRCEQDVTDYLSLLEQLDLYYESLLEYQRQKSEAGLFMSDGTADAVIAQCKAFLSNPSEHFLLSTFEERMEEASFLSADQKTSYINLNQIALTEHVFPAYELLIDGLTKLKGSGTNDYGLAYYEQGCDYYEALVACTTGTGRSMTEIISLLDEQIDTDLETIAFILTEHPDLLKTASRNIEVPEPAYILEKLEQDILQDFPAVNSGSCTIKYVAPSLENYLSPAFYLTPPLDLMNNHIIYINPAGNFDSLSLFTTLAHEGYPGHLYQTIYENSCSLNPVRNLFYFGGYVEGWATYAENHSYLYTGLDSEMAKLLSANSFLSLGLHARADAGIHYEGWTPEITADYFAGYGIDNPAAIESIYQAIVQDPGNYLKYYLGAVEILELKQTAQKSLSEKFDLKEFHDFFLSMGPAPFPVIETYLQEWAAKNE